MALTASTNGKAKAKNRVAEYIEPVAIKIPAPKTKTVKLPIRGTAPYVQNNMTKTAFDEMRNNQLAGNQAKKGKKRDPKDFDRLYREAMHLTSDGKNGIPVGAFQAALVRAGKLCGFNMTDAKVAFSVKPDAEGLVLFTKGKPQPFECLVQQAKGSDIRVRPRWDEWECVLTVEFDEDVLSVSDMANLVMRAGFGVGIGAGRPFSKNSAGCGWGTFEIIQD